MRNPSSVVLITDLRQEHRGVLTTGDRSFSRFTRGRQVFPLKRWEKHRKHPSHSRAAVSYSSSLTVL